jgi:hypothetical protein
MQINISTYFGKQTKNCIIVNDISAYDVHTHEEIIAIEDGFLINIEKSNKISWYLSRSTRIKVDASDKYVLMPDCNYKICDTLPDCYNDIYDAYMRAKGFNDLYRITSDNERLKYVCYFHNGNIVAITALMHYAEGLESYSFIWDYETPTLNLGTMSLYNEIAIAKDMGYEYLYTGSGYESQSAYKANFDGFQWFTGNTWSDDTQLYKKLCYRDSTVDSFKELDDVTLYDSDVDDL